MLERAPGIFEVELHSNQKSIDEIKIFLIPGKDGGRSLMVDAGFRSRTCLRVMEAELEKLGITAAGAVLTDADDKFLRAYYGKKKRKASGKRKQWT